MFDFSDKSFYVVGLARTGLAAVEFLLSQGASTYIWDDSSDNFSAVADGIVKSPSAMFSEGIYDRLSGVLLSPGIGDEHDCVEFARQAGVPLISDISLFAVSFPHVRHLAVTGTNGKSTVTSLLEHVLRFCGVKIHAAGNIGEPILQSDYIESIRSDSLFVLELSSYQIERLASPKSVRTGFRCEVAVLLNIASDHLERHKSMENYASVKAKLFNYLNDGGRAVIGIDDAYSLAIFNELKQVREHVVPISGLILPLGFPENGVGIMDGLLWDGISNEMVLDLSDLPLLQGAHNVQNIAATYAALLPYDLPRAQIVSAFRSFQPLAHRQENLGIKDKLLFINDSKATNSSAVLPAFRSFSNIFWLAGGAVKESDFSVLLDKISHVRRAYFYGKDKGLFCDVFSEHLICESFNSMEEAFLKACSDAITSNEEAVILLSPAAASFDQYRDFTQRGDRFKALVENFKQGNIY